MTTPNTFDVLEMFPRCSRCGEPVVSGQLREFDPARDNRVAHSRCLARLERTA